MTGFRLFICVAAVALVVTTPSAQSYQYRVGILPFVDATGTGGDEVGATLGRAVQADITQSTQWIGRVLKLDENTQPDELDQDKAVALARQQKVDVVVMGTVLEATSDETEKRLGGVSVLGQGLGGAVRSVSAIVTLQGDVFGTATGKKIDSIRVTGRSSDTKVSADVSTSLGDVGNDSGFQSSPIGKALHAAVAELVKRMTADESKFERYQPSPAASGDRPVAAPQ